MNKQRYAQRRAHRSGAGIFTQWFAVITLLCAAAGAAAHEPIAKCVLLDAQTVRCRGGFAHVEDAPGKVMEVIALDGTVLVDGRLGADSTLTFQKPTQPFYVLFHPFPGHQVAVEHDEIGPLPPKGRQAKWMQVRP